MSSGGRCTNKGLGRQGRCGLLVAVLVGLLILAGLSVDVASAGGPGDGSQAFGYRYFLPMWRPPTMTKLGLSGGTPEQAQALGTSWMYDWGTHPPVDPESGIESVPMIWGENSVGQPLGGNSAWVMGFNEPDLSIQANMSPEQGAWLWRQVERLYPDRLLVAPAPSDNGRFWLVQMREAYKARYGVAPRFDALAFHCYRWNAAECIEIGEQFVRWAREWGAAELWCTELAFVPAWARNPEYEARTFVGWLEDQPTVTRYSPYVAHTPLGMWYWPDTRPSADPSLFTGPQSTVLTAIGRWYQGGGQ